jgi:chromosome partitioning protein
MARIIAVSNQKGGTAKTTSAIHLGDWISRSGYRVLLVDLDPQGHLAEGFGLEADSLKREMSDVLSGKCVPEKIIVSLRPNLDLAPSNIRLSDMELTLVNMRFRETRLKRILDPLMESYDFIILDCPPSLGLLTVNALMAATEVVIPMSTDYYSMLGVNLLIRTINAIRMEANPSIKVIGIIPTRFRHTIHAREVVERTRAELGDAIPVFDHVVPESIRFAEASALGRTVFETAPTIAGAEAYRKIAEEIING